MGQFFRLLIIAVAVWLAIQLLRRALRPRPPAKHASASASAAPPRMLPCAYCGVHVPEAEAIVHGERVYCSKEHEALEDRNR